MKTVKILTTLLLVAGIFMVGCTTPTTTSTPVATHTERTPVATTAPASTETSAATTSPGATGGAYVEEWVVVQGNLDELQKEWNDMVASADKMKGDEIATKVNDHVKKHEELKEKVGKLKAESDAEKAHQSMIVEVVDIQIVAHSNFKEMKKEGIVKEEAEKLDKAIKADEEKIKAKLEEAKKKFEELGKKDEKKEEKKEEKH